MAYNELNRLQEIKHIQQLAQEKIDKYVFIDYKRVWRMLKKEKKFFKGYGTFLKYMSEPQVNPRIEKLQNSGGKQDNQLDMFQDINQKN